MLAALTNFYAVLKVYEFMDEKCDKFGIEAVFWFLIAADMVACIARILLIFSAVTAFYASIALMVFSVVLYTAVKMYRVALIGANK